MALSYKCLYIYNLLYFTTWWCQNGYSSYKITYMLKLYAILMENILNTLNIQHGSGHIPTILRRYRKKKITVFGKLSEIFWKIQEFFDKNYSMNRIFSIKICHLWIYAPRLSHFRLIPYRWSTWTMISGMNEREFEIF